MDNLHIVTIINKLLIAISFIATMFSPCRLFAILVLYFVNFATSHHRNLTKILFVHNGAPKHEDTANNASIISLDKSDQLLGLSTTLNGSNPVYSIRCQNQNYSAMETVRVQSIGDNPFHNFNLSKLLSTINGNVTKYCDIKATIYVQNIAHYTEVFPFYLISPLNSPYAKVTAVNREYFVLPMVKISKKLAIIYQIVFRNKSNYQNVIYNRSNREAENCYRGAHYWNRGTNCISNIDYTNSSLLIRKYDPLQNDGVYVLSYGLIQAEGSKPTYPFFDVSIEVTGIPYNLDEYVKNNIQLVISTSFVRSPLSQERNDNGQVYVVTSQTDQSEKKDYWMIARQDASIGYLYCGAPNSKDHFIQNHGIKLTFRIYLLTFDRKLYPVMTKEKTLHAVGTFKYSKTDPMYLLLFGTIICEANISSTLNASFNANILHSLSLYKQNNVILKESTVLDVTKRSEQTNLSKKLVHHFEIVEIVLKDQNGTILGSMDSNWSRTFMNGTVNTTDYPDNISIDVDFKDGLEYIKIEAKYSLGNHKYLFHHKEIIYFGPNDPRTSKLSQRHHTSLEDLKKQEKITKTFTIPFLIIFSILSYVTLILYHVIQSITS